MNVVETTLPLSALREGHAAAFGGKSAALGALLAIGIQVPPGFAVSTRAFHAFVAEAALEAKIVHELDGE